MSLTKEQVAHVAMLARLELSDAEAGEFTAQLGKILDYFDLLNRTDTEGVEPTAYVVGVEDDLRDDQVTNAPADDSLRQNAPALQHGHFRVPKIIE